MVRGRGARRRDRRGARGVGDLGVGCRPAGRTRGRGDTAACDPRSRTGRVLRGGAAVLVVLAAAGLVATSAALGLAQRAESPLSDAAAAHRVTGVVVEVVSVPRPMRTPAWGDPFDWVVVPCRRTTRRRRGPPVAVGARHDHGRSARGSALDRHTTRVQRHRVAVAGCRAERVPAARRRRGGDRGIAARVAGLGRGSPARPRGCRVRPRRRRGCARARPRHRRHDRRRRRARRGDAGELAQPPHGGLGRELRDRHGGRVRRCRSAAACGGMGEWSWRSSPSQASSCW